LELKSSNNRGGHEGGGRAPISWAPRASTDLLLHPIYTHVPRKHQGSPRKPNSTIVTFCIREIPSWSLRRRSAGGGIDHGGPLHHFQGLSDELWVVYHRPSVPWLLARWLLLSLWISIQSSPWSSWISIRCNSFCVVFVEIQWIVGLWSSLSMSNIWISSEFFYVWLSYLCKSLWIISLVWPTRLTFLAMGEVLSFGFNLVVSFPSDSRGSKARIVLLPSRIKRWGLYHIAWVYPSTSCHLS